MPFLILSVLWIFSVFIILLAAHEGKTWFVSSSIAIVSIFEWLLMFVEAGVFNYFGFVMNTYLALGALFINCILNITFMIIYLAHLKNESSIQENRQHYPKTHWFICLFSWLF